MQSIPKEDIQALRQRAATLTAEADALTEAYRRATWVRFSLVFFPIPFVVVLLRLNIESWHYFLAGGGYLAFSALLYVLDGRASDRCDAAERTAADARHALERATGPRAS